MFWFWYNGWDMIDDFYKISVVIPSYNAGRYICRAVDSVLGQEYPAYEIIVVDDGSNDNTREVLAAYGDKVRYEYQSNAGPGASRNRGVELAGGNWIAFLDADDIYLPWRLSMQVELLRANPGLNWCAGAYHLCMAQEFETSARANLDRAVGDVYDDYLAVSLAGKYAWTCVVLVRREIILQAGGFRTDIKFAEDIDLWWRIGMANPRYGYVTEPLAVYFLDIAGSLARYRQGYEPQRDLVLRNMKLASEMEAEGRFEPIAVQQVTDWVRGAKFDQRVFDIGKIVKDFRGILPIGFRLRASFYALFPRTTMAIFKLLSRLNQRYKIRKKLIRPRD